MSLLSSAMTIVSNNCATDKNITVTGCASYLARSEGADRALAEYTNLPRGAYFQRAMYDVLALIRQLVYQHGFSLCLLLTCNGLILDDIQGSTGLYSLMKMLLLCTLKKKANDLDKTLSLLLGTLTIN